MYDATADVSLCCIRLRTFPLTAVSCPNGPKSRVPGRMPAHHSLPCQTDRIGGQPFRIIVEVTSEPDRMTGSLNVGPRVMMGLLSRLLFITLFMTALIAHPADTTAANDIKSLAGGNTVFALGLYARLKTADGNLFFSPYSISTCLAVTYNGARGATAAQMADPTRA